MSGSFESISDFFSAANNSGIQYVILRNYENIMSPELYVKGHGDIDLLCEDSIKFAFAVGANSFLNKRKEICSDGYHYYIKVNGKNVSLDIRSVGDGYYCKKWEIDMLLNRIENEGYYIMNFEDYFYSLIHHSILQKRSFTEEYKERLQQMGSLLGLNMANKQELDYIVLLENYMLERGYSYTFPKDIFVPLNKKYIIKKELIESDFSLEYRHWIFDLKVNLLERLVSIKHLLLKNKQCQ